jgi:hypothetical protein
MTPDPATPPEPGYYWCWLQGEPEPFVRRVLPGEPWVLGFGDLPVVRMERIVPPGPERLPERIEAPPKPAYVVQLEQDALERIERDGLHTVSPALRTKEQP